MSPATAIPAKKGRRRVAQVIFFGFVLLAASGIAAPFLAANQYRDRIRSALEAALARKVVLGDVHFNLLTGPGFQVDEVTIGEDPSLGAEPFAYVPTLTAVPRVWSLLTGRLEFASLRLEGAQVNLARVPAAAGGIRWNFEPLLRAGILAAFPGISLKSARINFKAGNAKSVFYLIDADLDITPPATGGGDWQFRFRGEPARTDRPALGSGSFQAKGRWIESAGKIDLDLQLNKSELADLITLVNGEAVGLHGLVSGQAHLGGPAGAVGIAGRLNITDVHRWDQTPPKGQGWPLIVSGHLNAPAQELEIDARVTGKGNPILSTHYRIAGYLSQPRWGVSLECNRFPLEPLLPFVRHMGLMLPVDLRISGTLDGVVGYTGQGALEGRMAFHDTAVTIPDSAPIRFENAEVLLDRGHAHLAPAIARTAQNDVAQLEADYQFDTEALDLGISTDSMPVASLRGQAALAAVPLLEQMNSGVWNGKLRYAVKPGTPGAWTGEVQLSEVDLPFAGFSKPLRLDSAQAEIDGARVTLQRMRAHVGDIAAQGEYRYEPDAARPHRFRLSMTALDAADLEKVLMPILRRGNLISMALNLGRAPAPEWLRDWHAEGTIQIGALHIGGLAFERVRSRLLWDATQVALPDIQARFEKGTVASRVMLDLRNRTPAYRVSARFSKVDWKGGKLDADTLVETSGTGTETVANLRSQGSFTARGVDLAPIDKFRTVAGCYELSWVRGQPRARFTALQMVNGDDYYIGGGATQAGGQIVLQLESGAKQLSLMGTLENGGTLRAAQ